MKRFTAASFLLVTILTASILLQGQTRPRRVGTDPESRVESESRVEPGPRETPVERRANRSWRRILLGGASTIAIGAGRTCSPSRDVLIRRPRL